MSNGKKNYFRHSFFARNDIKLLMLRDAVGVGFYYYYFSLIELCGEQSADELKEEYEFHNSTIRSLWRINLKKSEHIASHMNAVGLLEFKKLEKSFWFRVPNLSKYLGKYSTKYESNIVSKGKEIKEKKKKVKDRLLTSFFSVQQSSNAPDIFIEEFGQDVINKGWNNSVAFYESKEMTKSFGQFMYESMERTKQKFGSQKSIQAELEVAAKELGIL